MSSKSVISLRKQPFENVRSFKYLGHVLCNDPSKSSAFLIHQISSAYAKWNEMKSVFIYKKIFVSTRVKFLKAFSQSLSVVCYIPYRPGNWVPNKFGNWNRSGAAF